MIEDILAFFAIILFGGIAVLGLAVVWYIAGSQGTLIAILSFVGLVIMGLAFFGINFMVVDVLFALLGNDDN